MRVLIASVGIEGGGAEQFTCDLSVGLAERGHAAMVAFLEGPDGRAAQLRAAGVEVVRLLDRDEYQPSMLADFTPSCIFRLRRLFRQFRPDVVHTHVPRASLWVALAKRLYRQPLPVVYREPNVQGVYPRWAQWVFRLFLPVVDHVVCISSKGQETFVERWGWPEAKVTTIWNAIDPARVSPSRTRVEVRQELGIPDSAPLVCNIGNLAARKGQDILVAAMAQVHRKRPDGYCILVGSRDIDPPGARFVEDAIHRHQAGEYVRLLGARRDVGDLLEASDLFVLSSRHEGFGIVLIEAMAAGKPVVTTDSGGPADVVVHGETGLVVPVEDPDALGEAIEALLGDPVRAQAMGEAGRRRVLSEFTIEAMVGKYIAVYRSLTGAG